jgi:hypothetical protein
MSSLAKLCPECGLPLQVGVARCEHCGAQVGTLFDENAVPVLQARGKKVREAANREAINEKVESAKERANQSVILGLASFFCPGIGFVLGIAGVVMSLLALKTLRVAGVEEGRGHAWAGLAIGLLGLVAQTGYLAYAVKSGKLPIG